MAAGVRVVFYKAWAFALSGFLAGVAGALLAGTFGQLDASAFAPTDSIVIFIGTLLGGVDVWLGVFLGGILTRFVPALLIDFNVNAYVGLAFWRGADARPAGPGGHRRPAHRTGREILREIPGSARLLIKINP